MYAERVPVKGGIIKFLWMDGVVICWGGLNSDVEDQPSSGPAGVQRESRGSQVQVGYDRLDERTNVESAFVLCMSAPEPGQPLHCVWSC